MAMSRADMVHADTQDGTACKTVPSSFLDGCLNLFSQEVFFGLVGDAIFIGLVVVALACVAAWFLSPKGENQV